MNIRITAGLLFTILLFTAICFTACTAPLSDTTFPDDLSSARETETYVIPAVVESTAQPQTTESFPNVGTAAADTTSAGTEYRVTEAETASIPEEPVDLNEFFENNLFVGDSILEGLAQYVRVQRQNGAEMLSDAKFLTSIMGIRVADLVGDTADYARIRYQYRGAVQELTEIVTLAAPKRLFLLVGMNDLAGGASVDETIARYERLLTQLKTDFPALDIVVMTPTPKTASAWLPDYCTNSDFGSPLLREFADRLIELCETVSVPCVDVFAELADETGNLPDEFSRDNYVHINDLGSAVVVEALNRFAEEGTVS